MREVVLAGLAVEVRRTRGGSGRTQPADPRAILRRSIAFS